MAHEKVEGRKASQKGKKDEPHKQFTLALTHAGLACEPLEPLPAGVDEAGDDDGDARATRTNVRLWKVKLLAAPAGASRK